MFEDFIGYQGSAVLDEPVQEENTAPKPPMRQKSEPPENTVLPHLPEQSVNVEKFTSVSLICKAFYGKMKV